MSRPETAAVRLLAGIREPVRLVALANIDIETGGLVACDGVTPVAGDRILLSAQTDKTEIGIYTATAIGWERASDARSSRAIARGVQVHVQEGTTKALSTWEFQTIDPNPGDDDILVVEIARDISISKFGEVGNDSTDNTPGLNLAIAAANGLPIYLGEGIYRFTVADIDDLNVKVYGPGSYRFVETTYTDEYGTVITVSNSLDALYHASPTPQFLYAPGTADGSKNLNYFDAPDATSVQARYFSASFIEGHDSGQLLVTGGNLMAIGHHQLEKLVVAGPGTIVGRRQARMTEFVNRWALFGTENVQRGFTTKPREGGHPNFDSLADANANSVETIWLRTGTAGSGERRWLEENDIAWLTATPYTAGLCRTNGGFSYACLISHTSAALFATDLAAGKWVLLNPTTQSSYTGASITTLGYVGSKRVGRYRGDPTYPGAWQMAVWAHGRDNLHNVLDGNDMGTFGYGNAASSIYLEGIFLAGSHNFSNKNRILVDVYGIGQRIGDNMIIGKRLVLGGTGVLKYTSRARDLFIGGDGSGIAIGCSDANGANPMTFELETDEPFAAQYGAIVGPANCRIVPGGFTSSFVGGYGNFDTATIVSNDINIGHLNIVTTTAATGGRIVVANRHPNTNLNRFLSIGQFAYSNTNPVIAADLENGGVIFNKHPAADMATATTCDLITGAFQFYTKNGTNLLFYTDVSNDAWLKSTDASGAVGPIFNLYRASASPAAADILGNFRFMGKDAGGNDTNYGGIRMILDDPTDGSEDGSLSFLTSIAGALAARMFIGAGFYASGRADPGTGNIACTNVIQYPTNSLTLGVNGQVGIELTNNTTITLKGRGSDGTTRTLAFTIA